MVWVKKYKDSNFTFSPPLLLYGCPLLLKCSQETAFLDQNALYQLLAAHAIKFGV